MIVELIYRWRIERLRRHSREESKIYITDLIRCPQKRDFELKFPELIYYDLVSTPAILGEIIHIGLESIVKEMYNKKDRVLIESEFSKKLKINGKEYEIVGRPDIVIIGGEGNKLIIEIKSAKSDMNIPYEHHILQTKLYMWLLNANEGYLVYITPERVCEYSISSLDKNFLSDDDVANMIKELLEKKNVPKYKWECKYCKFSSLCPYKIIKD